MKAILYIAAVFFYLLSPQPHACSAPPPPSVKEAYNSSKEIYLAAAISVKHSPVKGDNTGKAFEEEVVFKILESWKGSKNMGDNVVFKSIVGSRGGCGVSVKNDPPWLQDEDAADKENRYVPMSGVWLIYTDGHEPAELTATGRTSPIEYGGAIDMRELYEITMKAQKKKSNKGK